MIRMDEGSNLLRKCVNAHDRCAGSEGTCPYCDPVWPLRDMNGRFVSPNPDAACLIHGREFMYQEYGDPFASCALCEEEQAEMDDGDYLGDYKY